MAIQSYKVGPGTLKLGVAGAVDVSQQVLSCTVAASENVDEEDDINVLSGDVLEGEDTVSLEWTLSGSFLQDLAASGIVDYTWTNASVVVDFEYVPNTVKDRSIEGQVRLVPLDAGGEAKTRATSDFEWAIVGTPTLGDATP